MVPRNNPLGSPDNVLDNQIFDTPSDDSHPSNVEMYLNDEEDDGGERKQRARAYEGEDKLIKLGEDQVQASPNYKAKIKTQATSTACFIFTMTKLITLNLICPWTYQLLRSFGGDSGPDMSFDKSASLECLLSLARASLAGVSKLYFSSGYSEGYYTSSCPLVYMADVRCLSVYVIKLRDMPEGVLVLSGLSHVWKSRICDLTGVEVLEEPHHDIRLTLQRLPFYCTPRANVDVVILDPTLEDLAMGTPSAKILAKAEASQKQKASTSSATSSHVSKRTRSAMAQSSSITTRPSLFIDNSDNESDDDDACVEILLVTPICSAAVIPSLGNQGGSSTAPATKGPSTRDSRGKGITIDDVDAPFVGTSRSRPSFDLASLFRDVSGDAIHKDLFPFSAGPYYAAYPEGGVAGNYEFTREEWDAPYRTTFGVLTKEVSKDPSVCKMVVDQFPTPGEMIRVKTLSGDQLTAKMSVSHCMMMSHGGELLARLKGYEERVVGLTELELQVSALKRKIKSLTKSLDNTHVEVARFSADLNRATVLEAEKDKEILRLKATPLGFASFFRGKLLSLAASARFKRGLSMHQTKDEFAAILKKMSHFNFKHATEPVSVILQLKLEKLARLANIPALRDARVSPPIAKESTVTPTFESLELPTNVVPSSSVVASEQNEEWVNDMVDGPNPKITDGAANAKSKSVFMQGTSCAFDDTIGVTEVGSERASFSPSEIVVALSAGKKGDGSLPSSTADEEAVANPSRV
ncbi:hypothetical protein Tco_0109933 [Tanacetum coccineum]